MTDSTVEVWKNNESGRFFVTFKIGEEVYKSNEDFATVEEAEALASTVAMKH